MAHERIGTAIRTDKPREVVSGVQFAVPYGEKPYQVALSDEEMDRLLRLAVERLVARKAIAGFDFEIGLGDDLPLFIRAGDFELRSEGFSRMYVRVTTSSVTYEHRGSLLSERDRVDGSWRSLGYLAEPPLERAHFK